MSVACGEGALVGIPGCQQVDMHSPDAQAAAEFIEAATHAHEQGVFLAVFRHGSLDSYHNDPELGDPTSSSFMNSCSLLRGVAQGLAAVGAEYSHDTLWTWFSEGEGKHHKDRPHEGEEERRDDSSHFHHDCVRVTVHFNSVTAYEGREEGGELLNVGVVSSRWGRGTTHWASALDPNRRAFCVPSTAITLSQHSPHWQCDCSTEGVTPLLACPVQARHQRGHPGARRQPGPRGA